MKRKIIAVKFVGYTVYVDTQNSSEFKIYVAIIIKTSSSNHERVKHNIINVN